MRNFRINASSGGWVESLASGWAQRLVPSDWAREVTYERIVYGDRIRPFATRGVLLVAAAALLVSTHAPAWALVLLAVGGAQVLTEISMEPLTRASVMPRDGEIPMGWPGRRLVQAFYANHERGILNVTGAVGLLAVIAILVAVIFGPPPGPSPARVAALAVAILYANSAALGPLMDVTGYSPRSRIGATSWQLARVAWLLVAALIAGAITLTQVLWNSWGTSYWYGLMAVGLVYYPMLRVREYERALTTAEAVTRRIASERQQWIAQELHNIVQPVVKRKWAEEGDTADGAVRMFLDDVQELHRLARAGRIDPREGLTAPVQVHIRRLTEVYGVDITQDIELKGIDDDQYRRAKDYLTTLLDNAAQACSQQVHQQDRSDRLAIHVKAAVEGPDIVIEVHDPIPPMPGSVWDHGGSTIRKMRAEIERSGGLMEQQESRPGKVIRARWEGVPGLIRLGRTNPLVPANPSERRERHGSRRRP